MRKHTIGVGETISRNGQPVGLGLACWPREWKPVGVDLGVSGVVYRGGRPVLGLGDYASDLAAAIDRIVHHSIILELNIPSYRMAHAKEKGRAAGKAK